MADIRPTLTVPPTRKPSLLNKFAAVGLVAGFLIPGAVFTPVGLLVGAFYGRHKLKQEQVFGKQVSPPSNWNLGTLFGGLAGLNLGGLGGLAAGLLAATAISGAGLPLAIGIGVGVACAAACTWVGAKIGKFFQNRKYENAERYVAENGEFDPQQGLAQGLQQSQGKGMGQGMAPTTAPQPGVMQQTGMQPRGMAQAHQQMDPAQLARLQAFAAEGQRMMPPQQESMVDKVGHSRPLGPQER